MATRKSTSSTAARSRRWPWVILALFVAAALSWWRWGPGLTDNATVGTAYLARVACSCRYVADRSLADCQKDAVAGMEMISLSDDPANKTVTASFPLITSDSAFYREGYGCVLQEFDG